MTTPTRTIQLPEPGFPMLTRMISNALFAEPGRPEEPVTWIVSQPHPLVPQMKVVRMFVDRGGVEVYSVSEDGKNGMRNLIPMSWIRLIEEAMPLDVFVEELAAAEMDSGDDDEEEPGEPEMAIGPTASPSNGAVA